MNSDDDYTAEDFPEDSWVKLSQSESEYEPSQESTQDSDQDFPSQEDVTGDAKRVIVDKKLLLELFAICRHPGCGCLVDMDDVKMHSVGAAVSISATCTNSHTFSWSSSAKVGHGKRVMFVINLIFASFVLLCGLNIERVIELFSHLSLECISRSYFYNLQAQLLQRVVWMTWLWSQKKEIDKLHELKSGGVKTALSGDGRFDSRGFCASFATYSVQSLETRKVIATFVAHKHVVKSSGAMEPYAAKTILKNLVFDHNLVIDSLTTDRSLTMKTMLSDFNNNLPVNYPVIQHLYDIWHFIKSVLKDLWASAKLKSCEGLDEWIPSIQNQLWWAFSSSIGNPVMLKEKVLSIPSHLSNNHNFPENLFHKSCSHGQLGVHAKAWLNADSELQF